MHNPSLRFMFLLLIAISFATLVISDSGCSGIREGKTKMILSFYLDDTNPVQASPEAFKTFLEYCDKHGIKGESSLILGYDGESLAQDPDSLEHSYLDLAKSAYDKGIDSHMEIMTHGELFDFKAGHIHETGIHEGLWLHEPDVSEESYQEYFANILNEGQKYAIQFTGITWPGCGCDSCTVRYGELRESGPLKINPAVWTALLNLAKQGKFRGMVLSSFYESSEEEYGIYQKASDGRYGVYDLMPNAEDHFGIWENALEHVDPDYYISADGREGIIIRHLEENAPYCMWYMHWQGLNPGNGVGWEAFKTVIERIEKHLGDQVVWMRPSEIVTHYHDADGWDFRKDL
jgi:hypothetical protein